MDLKIWGGYMCGFGSLGRCLGGSWGTSWEVLVGLWRVFGVLAVFWRDLGGCGGRFERARGAETKKLLKKGGGNPPQGRGLGDHLDAKINPRRKEIKEKMDQAGKLKFQFGPIKDESRQALEGTWHDRLEDLEGQGWKK